MEHETIEQNTASDAKRTVFIGAKVTPQQKEEILARARPLGMTAYYFLLARASGYTPRARLTREEAALLQELDGCRSDLIRYTSALQGMSTSQRLTLFNQIPFMAGWFQKLRPVAEAVSDFLTAIREQNRVPSTPKPEEEK